MVSRCTSTSGFLLFLLLPCEISWKIPSRRSASLSNTSFHSSSRSPHKTRYSHSFLIFLQTDSWPLRKNTRYHDNHKKTSEKHHTIALQKQRDKREYRGMPLPQKSSETTILSLDKSRFHQEPSKKLWKLALRRGKRTERRGAFSASTKLGELRYWRLMLDEVWREARRTIRVDKDQGKKEIFFIKMAGERYRTIFNFWTMRSYIESLEEEPDPDDVPRTSMYYY
jgi:hypothetical protein